MLFTSFIAYYCGMDAIDHHLLELLRRDSRQPFAQIGALVGLSASAVKRRVDKLVDEGTIRQFTIDVDPAVEGRSVEAYVELHCRGTVAPKELQRILSTVPEVVGSGTVSGDADAIVHMRASNITALEEALEKVRLAPNVEFTKSSIVLSPLIDRR